MIQSGIDIIENHRITRAMERFGMRFLNRIYTPLEQMQAGGRVQALAARFAAKEAVSKMLGTGIGPVSWLEMEILDGHMGAPILKLHGRARTRADRMGLESWTVSMSHIEAYSVAVAAGIGNPPGEEDESQNWSQH